MSIYGGPLSATCRDRFTIELLETVGLRRLLKVHDDALGHTVDGFIAQLVCCRAILHPLTHAHRVYTFNAVHSRDGSCQRLRWFVEMGHPIVVDGASKA